MEGLSAETGMTAVTIYTRRFCGYCTAATKLLSDKGIAFDEIDATGDPDKRNEMIERSGRFTFPQIFIGTHHVGGYTDLYALHVSGELDSLLAAA
jgi:glutaredoxin 3